jgi:hypothetical protein
MIMSNSSSESWLTDHLHLPLDVHINLNAFSLVDATGFANLSPGDNHGRCFLLFLLPARQLLTPVRVCESEHPTTAKPLRFETHSFTNQKVQAMLSICQNLRMAFEIAVREQIERPPASAPPGTIAPGRTVTTSTSVIRDAAVKAWVIRRAKGVCECCGCPAPFECPDGSGFLEVHHLRTLADGGSDTVSNAAAVCPNCHRRMHFGKDAAAMKNQTIVRVPGLKQE